jgi:hypothetical protein
MARIKTFIKENDKWISHKISDMECLYSLDKDVNSKPYVILRTNGSKGSSVYQTLHIDGDSAKEQKSIFQNFLKL